MLENIVKEIKLFLIIAKGFFSKRASNGAFNRQNNHAFNYNNNDCMICLIYTMVSRDVSFYQIFFLRSVNILLQNVIKY